IIDDIRAVDPVVMSQLPALKTVKQVVIFLLERRDILRTKVDSDPFVTTGGVENRPVQFPCIYDKQVMLIERVAMSFYEIGHISRQEVIDLIPVMYMDRVFRRGLRRG